MRRSSSRIPERRCGDPLVHRLGEDIGGSDLPVLLEHRLEQARKHLPLARSARLLALVFAAAAALSAGLLNQTPILLMATGLFLAGLHLRVRVRREENTL